MKSIISKTNNLCAPETNGLDMHFCLAPFESCSKQKDTTQMGGVFFAKERLKVA